jgi:hypothetical protein
MSWTVGRGSPLFFLARVCLILENLKQMVVTWNTGRLRQVGGEKGRLGGSRELSRQKPASVLRNRETPKRTFVRSRSSVKVCVCVCVCVCCHRTNQSPSSITTTRTRSWIEIKITRGSAHAKRRKGNKEKKKRGQGRKRYIELRVRSRD